MAFRVKFVFGAELRGERERRLLTQKEAAAQVGVSARTWQLWEDGDKVTPRAKHQRRLIEWLETEVAA